jgi:hypothetical protein
MSRRRIWLTGLGFVILVIITGAVILLLQTPEPKQLVLDPNPVRQGGQVRVSVQGFFPAEPIVIRATRKAAGSDTVLLRESEASIRGSLDSAYVALPDNLESGVHVLQIVGQVSGRQATAVLYIRARAPWVTLKSNEAKPHAKIGLIAGGFDPGEGLRVSLAPREDSASTPPGRPATKAGSMEMAVLPTDRVGNTTWSEVKLPLVKPGSYSLVVRGGSSGQELRKDLTVTAYQPSVELSPWAGPPGTKVQLNSRGFEPGEKVAVYLGNATTAAVTVVADQYGNLWGAGPVRAPYSAAGTRLTIKLVGEDSTAETRAQFNVLKPKPWLELTQYWGAPGGSVEFSGGGWAGGERIAFYIGSEKNPPVAYGKADDYGWLHNAGPATIPKDAVYQVTFVAVGQQSHSVATATFKIVLPFGIRPNGLPPVPQQPGTPAAVTPTP